MAVKYYDDIIAARLQKWAPTNEKLRVLKPDEVKRYFETRADDTKDAPLTLPCITLSRNNDIELLLNIKNSRSYDGYKIAQTEDATKVVNVIPIKVQYQLDIYTKTAEEGDEYVREYLFKLINFPTVRVDIPYTNEQTKYVSHVANMRVLNTISDTSSIAERLFPGQFTRWTIQIELQDAFLFNIPYRKNWKLYVLDDELLDPDEYSTLELATSLSDSDVQESEELPFIIKQ